VRFFFRVNPVRFTPPQSISVLTLFVPFCVSILFASVWFRSESATSTLASAPRLGFIVDRNVAGGTLHEEALSLEAQRILATTNYLNATVNSTNDTEVRVFHALWRGGEKTGLNVVHHTPDFCWVGVGWNPIDAGQSRHVLVDLDVERLADSVADESSVQIPFECRIFESPDKSSRELVLWCTLLNGQPIHERHVFAANTAQDTRSYAESQARSASLIRHTVVSHFWHSLVSRQSGYGSKEFVRISARVNDDWQPTLRALREFAYQRFDIRKIDSNRSTARLPVR
jgi:hypothetical protein